jgi:pseudouridine synthase
MTQVLALDGVDLPRPLPMKYYLVNKPRGVLCTCSTGEGATAGERRKQEQGGSIMQHVPPFPPLVPCGRLDYESEGLIIMTNDGSLVHCITSPKYNIPKTYHVEVRRRHDKTSAHSSSTCDHAFINQ